MKIINFKCAFIKFVLIGLLFASVPLVSFDVNALELLCSKPKNLVSKDQALPTSDDGEFQMANGLSVVDLTLQDMFDVFKVGRTSRSNVSVSLCVLPKENKITRELVSELGLDANSTDRLFSSDNQTGRRVTVVTSEAEMSACVQSAYPSIGYVSKLTPDQENEICF